MQHRGGVTASVRFGVALLDFTRPPSFLGLNSDPTQRTQHPSSIQDPRCTDIPTDKNDANQQNSVSTSYYWRGAGCLSIQYFPQY
mmetsp:Transcript_6262/g.17017  ORF Transcript_6262/g.17017 Transcript_6262/m.17017 type:complete len:85 (-) Transcript_6262:884-1138(-)